jgi:hypothetical protein
MSLGIAAVLFMSNVLGVQEKVGIRSPFVLAFPWRVTLGTLVTVAVAVLFRTPDHQQAHRYLAESDATAAGRT